MKGGKLSVPTPKKKGGAPFGNRNYEYPAELRTTQFALEVAVKDIKTLKKQADALAKLEEEGLHHQPVNESFEATRRPDLQE